MREWQFAKRLCFTSPESSDTPKSSSSLSLAVGDREWTRISFVVEPVECRVNVMQWFCAGRLDSLHAFYEQKNEEKRSSKKKDKTKNLLLLAKLLVLESPGIDPGTSRMLSGHSTIWANSPPYICHSKVVTAVAVNDSFKEAQCSPAVFMIQVLVFLEAFAEEKETNISFTMFLRWLETLSSTW